MTASVGCHSATAGPRDMAASGRGHYRAAERPELRGSSLRCWLPLGRGSGVTEVLSHGSPRGPAVAIRLADSGWSPRVDCGKYPCGNGYRVGS